MATLLDPNLAKSDNLTGQTVARKGELPPLRHEVNLEVELLSEMVGIDGESESVHPLRSNEPLMITVATAKSVGVVSERKKNKATLALRFPICTHSGIRMSLSRRVGTRWRLIGYGTILD